MHRKKKFRPKDAYKKTSFFRCITFISNSNLNDNEKYEEALEINKNVDLEKKEIGVIAQEIEEHLPAIVKKGLSDYKAIRYEKIPPVLIEAIKEQQQQIKAQQQQIDDILKMFK